MIGWICEKYESAGRGPGVITHNNNVDPGGKSYGVYQFALNTGTLAGYVAQSVFNFELDSAPLGSVKFDGFWLDLSRRMPFEFRMDQFAFIFRQKYLPASVYAKPLGFTTDNKGIQEALFSIAVQHGGYKKIIADAQRGTTVADQIQRLYASRKAYVRNLTLPVAILNALERRYSEELLDVLQYAASDVPAQEFEHEPQNTKKSVVRVHAKGMTKAQ